MARHEDELQKYAKIWNVRLGLSDYLEIVCPKCQGCAVPYFCASLALHWKHEDVGELAKRLPFPVKIEPLTDENGFKLFSFPSENVSHPDIFHNNHSDESEHAQPIVTQCNDCHSSSNFGHLVNTSDLYWAVRTRHGTLWAFNREFLVKVRGIIDSNTRSRGPITSRLPSEMMKASNRNEMVKLIDRVLARGPHH